MANQKDSNRAKYKEEGLSRRRKKDDDELKTVQKELKYELKKG